jgi:signal transduction histidine kinase
VAAAAIAETGIATDSARRANAVLMRCLLGMSRLVDDLLEQSRIVFGKIELQRRPVRLADLVDAAVQGVAPGARKKRQELRVEHAPSDIWLHVDPLRVGQVLNNLLSNAVRYTREGGHVTVRVALQGGTAAVIIEDDGPGIPEDLLPHVFEPFVRGSIVEKGLGLGLPLALALTELHGGTIDVQNVPGGGARFTVRLPAVPPPR